MFDTELQFFIANQDDLVKRYRGTVLVIRDKEVVGAFPTAMEAYQAAQKQFPAGTYMLQPCEPGPDAYTVTVSALELWTYPSDRARRTAIPGVHG